MLDDATRGGAAGASIRAQGPLDAPGAGSNTQLGAKIAAPGDGSKSMLDAAARGGAAGASVRDQDPLDAPGGDAKSQLGGKVAAPGDGSRSMLDDSLGTGAAGQDLRDVSKSGPGAAANSQLGSKIDAPGDGSKSMLDDEVRKGAAGATVRDEGPIDAPGEDAVSMLTGQVFAAAPDPTSTRGRKTAGFEGTDESPRTEDQDYEHSSRDEVAETLAGAPFARSGEAADESRSLGMDSELVTAMAPKKRRKQRRSRKWLYLTIGLAASVVVLGVAGLLASYLGRGSDPSHPSLDQLLIAQDSNRIVRIGGADTLIVDGHISNNGSAEQRLRPLRLELYSDKEDVLLSSSSNACAIVLPPGAACSYQVRIRLPESDGAKPKFAVVWGEFTEPAPPS